MCGRVRLSTDWSEIKVRFRFDRNAPAPNMAASWNVAPTDPMLVATRSKEGERIPQVMRWGLVPWFAKDIKEARATFNARAESVATKPTFRDPWKRGQRGLIITNGFYEWRKPDKQPFAIGVADDPFTVMAGLWEEWKSPSGERIKSCTVITTNANEAIAELHDRMPVILDEKNWPKWLGEEPATNDELKALLVPCPSERIKLWPVDRRVGNVKNNGAELAEPLLLA